MLVCHCALWRLPGSQKRWPARLEDPVGRMAAHPNTARRRSSCTFAFSIKLVIKSQPGFGVSPNTSFFSRAAAGGEQKEIKNVFGDTPNPGRGWLPSALL